MSAGRDSALTWTQAGWLLLAGIVLAQVLLWQPWRLTYNFTVSEPLGFYAYRKIPAGQYVPKLGDLIVFSYSAPSWALGRYAPSGALFLKRVGAVPGETLILHDNGRAVAACSGQTCRELGVALERDSRGRSLPIRALKPNCAGKSPRTKMHTRNAWPNRTSGSNASLSMPKPRTTGRSMNSRKPSRRYPPTR